MRMMGVWNTRFRVIVIIEGVTLGRRTLKCAV